MTTEEYLRAELKKLIPRIIITAIGALVVGYLLGLWMKS